NATRPQISSAVSGSSNWTPEASSPPSAAIRMSGVMVAALDREGEHETEQGEGLDHRDADEHRGTDRGRCLRLAGHRLDRLADQDAQADAGADRAEAEREPVAKVFHSILLAVSTAGCEGQGHVRP